MAKLTKFKAQKVEFPTHYRIEETNRGDAKIKNITPAYGNINEAGTPETEVIYDGMQLGNVHTLHAVKTTSLGIDYYSCDLDGLNEFGLKNDLKIRLTVDSDNKNINPKLRLNSVDYTILKEFKGTLLNLNAGDLKQNKTYELTYNGNQFVVINITEFGTETDTVLEGKRLAEIIGLEFGGNIQDTGMKSVGKFYFDTVNKYYYECIVNNNLTYNDVTKFRAISNKPISDKLENLFETHWINLGNNTPIGKVFETSIKVPTKPYKLFYSVFTGGSKFIDLKVATQYASSEIVVNLGVSNTGFLQYSVAKNTSVIDGRHICVMFVF
jgi:hypothetical protein|nr:MAG TPA: hypothetical protein [Caudoviricetes sp.]